MGTSLCAYELNHTHLISRTGTSTHNLFLRYNTGTDLLFRF